jgi:hypothetical protein
MWLRSTEKRKRDRMNNILNVIDTDTAWFIVAVLVILLLSALAGWRGAKRELNEITRRQKIVEARRRESLECLQPRN